LSKLDCLGYISVADSMPWSEFDAVNCEDCRSAYSNTTGPFKVTQVQRFWYRSKACMQLPVSEQY